MHFKTTYTLQHFRLRSQTAEEFVIDEEVPVRVVLRRPSETEISQGFKDDMTFCEAYAQLAPNEKTLRVFNDIETGILRGTPDRFSIGYKDAHGQMIYLPDELPNSLLDFFGRASGILSRAITRLVHIVRWRTDAHGPHRALATRGLEWSRDANWWSPAPTRFSLHVEQIQVDRSVGKLEKEDIVSLIQAKSDAPLHHEMFREAWHQRLSHPRSSVIMAMASLEIAVKYCIGKLIPNAQWLAENVPSPPVVTIIKDMFPSLPAVCSLPPGAVMLPKHIEEKLKSGVSIRNGLAHAGKFTVQSDSMEEILTSVKDTLWLIDFLCGQRWAYGYIRESTRQAIEANVVCTSSPAADDKEVSRTG
jgi:hypothetical protein